MEEVHSPPRSLERAWLVFLVILTWRSPMAGAETPAMWLQFKGTFTRVIFSAAGRREVACKVEFLVPRSRNYPARTQLKRVLRISHDAQVDDYEVKSSYATRSVSVLLAQRGHQAITAIFPAPTSKGGQASGLSAVLLFDDSPVSNFVPGTWYPQIRGQAPP